MMYRLPILLLAALAECSPQLGLLGGRGGGWKKISSKFVTPFYRQEAKREIVKYGPLELAGKDVSTRFYSIY
jgi:hypothetical protein